MKSVVCYGPRDLRVEDQEQPVAGGPDEVLVNIDAGGICDSDLHYYKFETANNNATYMKVQLTFC